MSTSYQVYFNASGKRDKVIPPGTILISAKETNWNNFGWKVEIFTEVVPAYKTGVRERRWEYEGFLGVLEETDLAGADVRRWSEAAANVVSTSTPGWIAAERLPNFFTMLPDMKGYRSLVRTLGTTEAKRALVALHDIVGAEEFGSSMKYATLTRVFQLAFLRRSEAYFAWKNAAPVLRGLEFEQLHNLSDEIKVEFQLDGRPVPHRLTFRFESDSEVLPKRFAVIIGKNGVGKSQTLNHIVHAALSRRNGLTDGRGQRVSINRLLAFSSSSAAASAFPGERRTNAKTWYKRFLLNSPGHGKNKQTSSELIVQLARHDETIVRTQRFDLFLDALAAIDDWQSLALVMQKGHGLPVRLEELRNGGEQEVLDRYAAIDERVEVVRRVGRNSYPLSSGELSFVRFAAMASYYIENGSLLLFDEPETHLHPNFISRFVAILDSLLEATGSIAIIATHSAYLVREAFEDQVLVLSTADDGSPIAVQPTLKTFGANVGAISHFVFGEDEPSRLAKEVERKISASSTSWDAVFEKYKDELSLEVLGDIRAAIEDPA